MSRRVYLIRHGRPDFPDGSRCLGRADIPLGTIGHMQSCLAARELEHAGISAVFTSPLSRARETAAYFSPSAVVIPGLREADMGLWDGLSFREIKERFPELYERRGVDMSVPIPGAEEPRAALCRFEEALMGCLDESGGDIAVVSHSAVIRLMAASLSGTALESSREYRVPYCACVTLEYDGGFRLVKIGEAPRPELDRALCLRLLHAAGAPEKVIEHCAATAEEALRIAAALKESGNDIDAELVENAALLHDIARSLPEHSRRGADWLSELGYTREAELVRCHHEPEAAASLELTALCLADNLRLGARRVSLEERFSESLKKCRDDEALRAHERRRREALAAARRINGLCGRELINIR